MADGFGLVKPCIFIHIGQHHRQQQSAERCADCLLPKYPNRGLGSLVHCANCGYRNRTLLSRRVRVEGPNRQRVPDNLHGFGPHRCGESCEVGRRRCLEHTPPIEALFGSAPQSARGSVGEGECTREEVRCSLGRRSPHNLCLCLVLVEETFPACGKHPDKLGPQRALEHDLDPPLPFGSCHG